ncbi:Uncharacterised protein [Bartonella vinsonii]|uniref:Uncharacterized protein n=1 Tax=Bartonella vinsonii TaxID=33047 RepID=A0A448V8R4_BARVI|nr:Uncharacterised protein [Bartonella vinsonii]
MHKNVKTIYLTTLSVKIYFFLYNPLLIFKVVALQ